MTTRKFETEVNQLLHLIIHSLYSHKEIFIRELVSNASDALDKLKYLTLTDEAFKSLPFDPRIDISFDKDKKTLSIADTGIGMNEADLMEQLGTIAKSGTRNFVAQMTGDAKKDSNLIGQFGVGFYSCFMVADRVDVVTRRAGEDTAWQWSSDGKGEYEISGAQRDTAGTTVTLHLNDNGIEYANRWQIESIIKKYSNHIPFPIHLHFEDVRYEGKDKDRKEIKEQKVEKINEASALWKCSKQELKDEDYKEFYKSIGHDTEDPLLWVHTKAEGTMEYATLFYVPKKAPLNLYYSDFKPGVKLYVKRVFITDDDHDLLPRYLRFVRGVIDSEDLPLNVSREILQQNRVLAKIKSSSVKKLLDEFKSLAADAEKYAAFYKEFGRLLKEGLYQDYENREDLLELVRFKSTGAEGFASLANYKDRMQADQKAIYYVTGEKEETLRESPLLEMYRKKNIEVLIMDDPVDELVMPSVGRYKDIEFKSINRSDAAEELKTEQDKQEEKKAEPVIKRMKDVLGNEVKEVKASARLSDSPCCIVVDEKDPTVQMQSLLKAMGQEGPEIKPILEINPTHEIIKKLESVQDDRLFEDATRLLYEQALLIEGAPVKKPVDFVRRLNSMLGRAL
ncbi:MAG: molecular chaperone HtpG [Deltaproteobacteria bacterium]|nr:molecular chaperone HtpG [Deltaproteobacteria bacterium]